MAPLFASRLVLPNKGYSSLLQAEQHIKSELLALLLLQGITPKRDETSLAQVAGLFFISGSESPFQLKAISNGVFARLDEITKRIVDTDADINLPGSDAFVCILAPFQECCAQCAELVSGPDLTFYMRSLHGGSS